MDLTKPEYGNKQIGQVVGAVRRHDLDAHRCSSARCWARTTGRSRRPSSPRCIRPAHRCPTRWCAARSRSRRCSTTSIYTKKKDGAPVEIFFPPEGVPMNIVRAPASPRRRPIRTPAKLFLNWALSDEAQTFMIKELGNLTSLKTPPAYPPGFDPKVVKAVGARTSSSTRSCAPSGSRNGTRPTAIGSRSVISPSPRPVTGRGNQHNGERMSAELKVERLRKVFATGMAAVDDVSFRIERRRDRRAARALGLRQDHDAALRRRPGAPDLRHHRDRRRRRLGARAAASWCRRGCATSAWCSSPMRCGRT